MLKQEPAKQRTLIINDLQKTRTSSGKLANHPVGFESLKS